MALQHRRNTGPLAAAQQYLFPSVAGALARGAAQYAIDRARQYKFTSGNTQPRLYKKLLGGHSSEHTPPAMARTSSRAPGAPRRRGRRGRRPPTPVNKRKRSGNATATARRPLKKARASRRRRAVASGGVYTGVARQRTIKKSPGLYERQGASCEIETSGSNIMDNCLYMGVNGCRPYHVGRMIGIALIRHIYRKFYGVDFPSPESELNGSTLPPGVSAGFTIKADRPYQLHFTWMRANSDGTVVTGAQIFTCYDMTTGVSQLVTQFADWFAINVWLTNNVYQGLVSEVRERVTWMEVQVLENDGSTQENVRQKGTIRLEDLRLTAYAYTNVTVQNTTTSETGSFSTDVVDSNPVVGKTFTFRGPTVVVRNPADLRTLAPGAAVTIPWPALNVANHQSGLLLPSTNPPTRYQTVPDTSMFKNLRVAKAVQFQPGESKMFKLKWTFKGTFNYLYRNLAQHCPSSSGAMYNVRDSGMLQTTWLLALEKRIKGTKAVAVNYHMDHYCGARVTGFNKRVLTKEVILLTQSNDPPDLVA